MDMPKHVTLYADGACSGNPGPGGYGSLLIYEHGPSKKHATKELSSGYRQTTNNRMELMAVIRGLEALREPCCVTLYTDSRYVSDAINKGWAKRWRENNWMRTKTEPALNADLWEVLLSLLRKHQVECIWVKGHASIPGNERCDFLARGAISNEGDWLEDTPKKI